MVQLMSNGLIRLILLLSICCIAVYAQAERTVVEFRGSSNTTTAEFSVRAPWILDWRVSGSQTHTMGFEITLLDGKTRMHKGRVLKSYSTGNGVRLFNESGSFRFRISSGLANWHLKVKEITEAEARQYTPRGGG